MRRTMKLFSKVISLGLLSQIAAMSLKSGPVVTTTTGQYRGLPPNEYGVVKFLGIPFAKPPIGNLRFKPPELISPHAGVSDVTRQTAACPQLRMRLGEKLNSFLEPSEQNENCLHLDIYVPTSVSSESPKAVLVIIHGGGYVVGFKNKFDGSILVGMNDVIVVTINYRLGILGFMTTGDENAVGNYGLMDQIVALKWIQQNIEGFGGDKNRVTISGESAGGASVAQLALSPASKGLIHRVIAQSGSALGYWTHAKDVPNRTTRMGQSLECPTNSTIDLVECLRQVPVEDLLVYQKSDDVGLKWLPVYNNDFFPFTTEELKSKWEYLASRCQLFHTDLMIGVCTEESAVFYAMIEEKLRDQNIIVEGNGMSREIFNLILERFSKSVVSSGVETLRALLPSIFYKYTDWAEPAGEYSHTKMTVQFLSDIMFNAPGIEFARAHAELTETFNNTGSESPAARTFLYSFNQAGSWMPTSPWRSGADHGDDLFFMTGLPFSGAVNATVEEKLFSRKMMKYWTNFVKTGDPNQPITEELHMPTWPRFESVDEKYLVLDVNLSADSVKTRMLSERVAFWLDFIPKQIEALKMNLMKCPKAENPETLTQNVTQYVHQ